MGYGLCFCRGLLDLDHLRWAKEGHLRREGCRTVADEQKRVHLRQEGCRAVADEHHPCSCPMELGGGGGVAILGDWEGARGTPGYSIGPDQGRRTLRHRSCWGSQVGGVGRGGEQRERSVILSGAKEPPSESAKSAPERPVFLAKTTTRRLRAAATKESHGLRLSVSSLGKVG